MLLFNVRKYYKTYIEKASYIDLTMKIPYIEYTLKKHTLKTLDLLKGRHVRMTTTNQIKDVQPIRSKEQIQDMKDSLKRWCSERDYILFLIGINAGLRIGDLLKLKVSDLKGKKRVVIKEGKTSKKREHTFTNNVYKEIQAYIETVDSEWLFPSRKGDKSISTTQAYRQLVKAGDMVDMPEGIGTHTMRKTFGYWYYKRTKNIYTLQAILNHSDISITKRYIGITQDEINNTLIDFEL